MNLGVLSSHEGTTLQAILDACESGVIAGRVSVVISNNSDSGALRRARLAGAEAVHLSSKTHPDPGELDRAIVHELERQGVEIVMLAGYMRKLGPEILARYPGRILNTHPALLPKFGGQGMYGMRVHEAVLRSGETVTGATVHLVDGEYDHGAAIARVEVPVEPGDTAETLARRVQASERGLVVQVLAELASGARTLGSVAPR